MKKLSLIVLALVGLVAYAQETTTEKEFESEVMTTDRGSYTKTGTNIFKGLQIEAGMDYEWTDSENPTYKTDNFSPIELTARLGLSKYVELDFTIANRQLVVRPWDENGGMSVDKYNYWSPLQIAVRTQFIDSKKKCNTDASFFVGLDVYTTQRSAFEDNGTPRPWVLVDRPGYVAPELAFFVNHDIGKRFQLAYNVGLKWTGRILDDAASAKNPDFYYTVRGLFHLMTKMDVYVEHYNFIRKAYYPTMGLNAGIRYAISPKFVVDVNGGFGFNKYSPDGYAGLGLSYKLGKAY